MYENWEGLWSLKVQQMEDRIIPGIFIELYTN